MCFFQILSSVSYTSAFYGYFWWYFRNPANVMTKLPIHNLKGLLPRLPYFVSIRNFLVHQNKIKVNLLLTQYYDIYLYISFIFVISFQKIQQLCCPPKLCQKDVLPFYSGFGGTDKINNKKKRAGQQCIMLLLYGTSTMFYSTGLFFLKCEFLPNVMSSNKNKMMTNDKISNIYCCKKKYMLPY